MRALEVVAKKPRVLVVDDFDDVREMYVDYLKYLGFDADGAANGREAVRKTLAHKQSLVVMDLAMPVLDGWEATRILRADRRTRDIPIVVLTGAHIKIRAEVAPTTYCRAYAGVATCARRPLDNEVQ